VPPGRKSRFGRFDPSARIRPLVPTWDSRCDRTSGTKPLNRILIVTPRQRCVGRGIPSSRRRGGCGNRGRKVSAGLRRMVSEQAPRSYEQSHPNSGCLRQESRAAGMHFVSRTNTQIQSGQQDSTIRLRGNKLSLRKNKQRGGMGCNRHGSTGKGSALVCGGNVPMCA
jgi:hypothetical protein